MEAVAVPALLVLIVALIVVIALRARRVIATEPESLAPARPAVPVLQGALLPSDPPIVDGLRISWSYVAATQPGTGGGDFYDAFFLDDGTVGGGHR